MNNIEVTMPPNGVERREHTPESVMRKLAECEKEVSKNLSELREELTSHQDIVKTMHDDWEQFLEDFQEMLSIFRSARGFFTVLGWIGKGVRWVALSGIAIGAIWAAIKTGIWK